MRGRLGQRRHIRLRPTQILGGFKVVWDLCARCGVAMPTRDARRADALTRVYRSYIHVRAMQMFHTQNRNTPYRVTSG